MYRWEESHEEAEYTNWAPGEPDTADDPEIYDCVWKNFGKGLQYGPGWHSLPCTYIDDYYGSEPHALCEASRWS